MWTEHTRRLNDPTPSVRELKEHVEKFWRKTRPRLMKLYDEKHQTDQRIETAAQYWLETIEDLRAQGLPYDQAYNLAMSEWVALPDIDDEDEAALGS